MALIPQEEIKQIRSSVNIVDVISKYIPLDHKGKNYFGVCPFHEDHSPSMSVSEEKQIYKCFSCGAAGNVFTFIQNYENVSFIEAVEMIAKENGIALSASISSQKTDKYNKYYEIMDVAEKFFVNNLKTTSGKNANMYLQQRGLTKSIIEEFGIGLALNDRNLLYQVLKSKKYNEDDIQKVALINIADAPYDVFINRIMFPLHDINGKIVGFSGRIYDNGEGAKYVNTRETILFKKGQMLFNYHRAKPHVRNDKSVIIVEGYMDAIRLYANGIKNVIAIMGTALTKDQINLLYKLNCKIILCLDNDGPGHKAMYDIGQNLRKQNFEVEVIALSGAKDPDEYILKEGVEAFKNNLKNPIKYLEYSLRYLKQNKNLNQTVDLAAYINDVLTNMSKENDEILVNITLKKLSQDYDLDYDILLDKLKRLTDNTTNYAVKQTSPVEKKENKKINSYDIAAKNILFFMMNDEKYVRIFQKNLVFLNNVNYREISKAIIYYYETNKEINIADFLSFASSNERFHPIVLDIVSSCSDVELNEDIFNDYLETIDNGNKKKTINELKQALKDELDKNKKREIAMKIAEIKKGSV